MPERDNSRLRKKEILEFMLFASEMVLRARTPFFAINSNQFEKPWEFDYKIRDYNDEGKKVTKKKTITRKGPSRKIFLTYYEELLKEKLLTRIKTSDERSKYYSITPLGICHLIKSAEGDDRIKYPWPERFFVIQRLQTFAAPNVKPYSSIIFEGQKFISHKTNLWEDLAKWLDITLRHQIVHVFSNFDIYEKKFDFNITTGYNGENKIKIASFDLEKDNQIEIQELNKVPFSKEVLSSDPNYKSLRLDDEQFHHYLANLMICSLIFDSALARFDIDLILINRSDEAKRKKDRMVMKVYEGLKQHPDYFKNILILFSKHVESILNNQYGLITKFRQASSQAQFAQT